MIAWDRKDRQADSFREGSQEHRKTWGVRRALNATDTKLFTRQGKAAQKAKRT